jgi:hypothetical protein
MHAARAVGCPARFSRIRWRVGDLRKERLRVVKW